jgi:hypothetical protein
MRRTPNHAAACVSGRGEAPSYSDDKATVPTAILRVGHWHRTRASTGSLKRAANRAFGIRSGPHQRRRALPATRNAARRGPISSSARPPAAKDELAARFMAWMADPRGAGPRRTGHGRGGPDRFWRQQPACGHRTSRSPDHPATCWCSGPASPAAPVCPYRTAGSGKHSGRRATASTCCEVSGQQASAGSSHARRLSDDCGRQRLHLDRLGNRQCPHPKHDARHSGNEHSDYVRPGVDRRHRNHELALSDV